ncbi:lantibiotic dehydratase [Actinoplanes sp. NBC_00393]|uniref:lantibiotic dehydratase n=1 Tax=Actinoplanes sp. NBC_00393 TaxID=2975953 RepID=UPI002E1A86D2
MYRCLEDALLARVAVCCIDQIGAWPDLNSAATWRPWLSRTLQISGFAGALRQASPDLSARVDTVLTMSVSERDTRGVVLAVMRYLLRATTRATPYGLFAGVAPASVAATGTARLGVNHRPMARIPSAWLTTRIDELEADPSLRPHLQIRANNLVVQRGAHALLEHRAGERPDGAPVHLRVRATAPVRSALALATDPISWGDLTAKLVAETGAAPAAADRLVEQLVRQQLLLTNLRPPTIVTDPLTAVVTQLEGLPGEPADTLRSLRAQRVHHDASINVDAAAYRRQAITATIGEPAGVDLRADCDVTVPRTVTSEACRAATALVRLARPATIGWAAWHLRFLERYGLHALVPVRDAVDAEIGLGYPHGFTGTPPAPAPALTDRDRALLALAQRAALRRQQEVALDDDAVAALVGDQLSEAPQPTTELTVRVHAPTMEAIQAGDFRLSVVRVSRHAGSTTGRFLDLPDAADRQRMAIAYAAGTPAAVEGALIAQLSAATRYISTQDVARSPRVLPFLVSIGEYIGNAPDVIELDDIAVTADADRLYLISMSRRRPVQPVPVNAVEPVQRTLPLVRFLAEAPTAFMNQCTPLDWGPATRDLPFLPSLRYGRTVLAPARWLLTRADLSGSPACTSALADWREATGCPDRLSLGGSDQQITLDLREPAHEALLRDHLDRTDRAVLHAAPPADASDWINGHAHEIVIPLAATTPPLPAPRLPDHIIDVRRHGSFPGSINRHYLKIYTVPGRQNTILLDHLPALLAQLPYGAKWWIQRYSDPEPHLRLRITGTLSTTTITGWTEQLRDADVTCRVQWDTDFPETARFGGPVAYPAAEAVFAADSAAALTQLAAARRGSDPQALTAASLLDITTALIGDPSEAARWLIGHTRTHRPAPNRAVYDQAIELAGPCGLTALPEVRKAWRRRQITLGTYRDILSGTGTATTDLLPDLLHLHHARVMGPDLDSERACLHLARAAALSWSTRARSSR